MTTCADTEIGTKRERRQMQYPVQRAKQADDGEEGERMPRASQILHIREYPSTGPPKFKG
jgi:hypothetical protein